MSHRFGRIHIFHLQPWRVIIEPLLTRLEVWLSSLPMGNMFGHKYFHAVTDEEWRRRHAEVGDCSRLLVRAKLAPPMIM